MRILIPILLIFLGVLNSQFASGQTAKFLWESSSTRYIKDIYEYVHDKIESNQYYLNEFKINSNNLPWINSRSYQNTQQYYYSFVGDATPVLRFVSCLTKIAEKNYYTEFLYDIDGNLVFYYEKQNDRQKYSYEEFRAFFENKKCINIVLNSTLIDETEISKHNTKLETILQAGMLYSARFLKDMNEVKDEH